MSLSIFCAQQRQQQVKSQTSLVAYALIASSLLHIALAWSVNRFWQPQSEKIAQEEPMELILIDQPPEVQEEEPEPEPIPETKVVEQPSTVQPQTIPTAPPQQTTQTPPVAPIVPPQVEPEPQPQTQTPPPQVEPEPQPQTQTEPEIVESEPLPNTTPLDTQLDEALSTDNNTQSNTEVAKVETNSPGDVVNQNAPSPPPNNTATAEPLQNNNNVSQQFQDNFATDGNTVGSSIDSNSNSVNSTNSPGDVAINQTPPGLGESTEEQIQEITGGVECVDNCQPDYPDSIRDKVEGTSTVRVILNGEGEVIDSELITPSGNSELDQAAVADAKKMRFTSPGTEKASLKISINYTIEDSDFAEQQEQDLSTEERQAEIRRQRLEAIEQKRLEEERQAQTEEE